MNISQLKDLKNKRKITMLTAYDFATANLVERAGIDIILIGDSLANVVLGLDSTTQVGMPEMLHHTRAVRRGAPNSLLIGDMPYSAYQVDPNQATANALQFIEAGCAGVKLEWFPGCADVATELLAAKIPVMGHIGLTPQTAEKLGGFKCRGKDAAGALKLIQEASLLEKLGCFAIVLECVPDEIAALITKKLSIPTIGIGAGVHCDGQVLVINDLLGLFERHTPKFVKKYAQLSQDIFKAITDFKTEVSLGKFPGPQHSFTITEEELKKIIEHEP